MPTDPRLVLRRMLDPFHEDYAVTIDNVMEEDGITHAKVEATYELNELMLQRLTLENPFNIDGIYLISLLREDPPDMSASGPICYNYIIGVQAVTINKYNSDGTMKVNGDTLGRDMKEEVRKVIRENPLGSLRDVRGTTHDVTRSGSSLIYGDVMEVLYKQYAARY